MSTLTNDCITAEEFASAPKGATIFNTTNSKLWTFIDEPTVVGKSPYLVEREMRSETNEIKKFYFTDKYGKHQLAIVDEEDCIFLEV